MWIIVFILALATFYLAKDNHRLLLAQKLIDEKTLEDLEDYAKIKRLMENGELVSLNNFDDYITGLTSKHENEKKELNDKLANIIIRADEIAGERAQNLLDRWRLQEEKSIRADAIKRSQDVIKGKVTEHLVPHLPDFRWDPRDVRFLGTPLDYVVFEGLSEGNVTNVIFVEVKTGKTGKLSTRERKCRDAIIDGRVSYEKLHIKD